MGSSCARQGYHPHFAYGATIAVPEHASDPDLDGAFVPGQVFPWFLSDTPAEQEFQGAMARYLPGVAIGPSHSTGWVSAKLFERVAGSLKGNPTSADLLGALYALRGETLGGLTAPLTFVKGQNPPASACYYQSAIGGGKFSSPNCGAIACL